MSKIEASVLSVSATPNDDNAHAAAGSIGTHATRPTADSGAERQVENEPSYWRRRLIVGSSLLGPLLLLHFFGLPWPLNFWLQAILGTAMQCYVGWPFYASALQRLAHLSANIDTLMAIGTTALYGLGIAEVFWHVGHADRGMGFVEAGLILQVVTLRRYFVARAKRRRLGNASQVLNVNKP